MFHNQVDLLEIVARATIVYFAIFFGLRIGGKRELGQMTAFDLAVVLLIANAVQNAMVGADVSVTGGLAAAAVLFVLNWGVGTARERIPFLRELLEGKPTTVIQDGKFLTKNMEREGIDQDMVEMAMREHGIDDLQEVKQAVMENDGSISVVSKLQTGARKKVRKRSRFVKRG
ncbi:MAG: YetF domain-containing protein [Chloroflexota bacterium]